MGCGRSPRWAAAEGATGFPRVRSVCRGKMVGSISPNYLVLFRYWGRNFVREVVELTFTKYKEWRGLVPPERRSSMALITRFDTPASLRDLPADSVLYDKWHDFLLLSIPASTLGGGNVGEFYNASVIDVNVAGERSLVWMAFPRSVLMPNRDDRDEAFAQGENRDVQNEYCEWRVSRNADNKITKVEFVTESPEYWEKLWEVDRARVVELYQELVGDLSVTESDLHDGTGRYLGRNRWNNATPSADGSFTAGGIVHLIQNINTLTLALDIAQRISGSDEVNDNYEKVGLSNTSVDPRVDLDVNALVRKSLSITLRDPIALYIAAWDDTGWTKPNGKPVGNYWRIVRGRPGQVLRLEYEVPAKEGFVVGDIRIGGRPIQWGGQIAEHVTVTIVGTAGTRASGAAVPTPVAKRGRNEESIEKQTSRSSHKGKGFPRQRGRQGETR